MEDEGKAVGSVTWPTVLLFEPNSSGRTSNAKGTSIPHNRLLLASLASSTGDVAPAEVLSSLRHCTAFGTKRTSQSRLPMSAFGGKADIAQSAENARF